MKVWQIDWTDDKQYTDSRGLIWTVVSGDLFKSLDKKAPKIIYDEYPMREILELDFEPVVDWSKIEVDTKILVSEDGIDWVKRYFAKYEDGKVHTFSSGRTKWTSVGNPKIWEYAKLADEEM